MRDDTRQRLRALRIQWLNLGCDGTALAVATGKHKQTISAALARINAEDPLYWGEGDPETQRAMQRAARMLLETRGVRWRTPLAEVTEADRGAG